MASPNTERFPIRPRMSEYLVIDTIRRTSLEYRTLILNTLSFEGLKDPASIICSYALPSEECLKKLEEFRRYTTITLSTVYTHAKDVMLYARLLSQTIGGEDLLGYDRLFHDRACYNTKFLLDVEKMVLARTKITHDMIIESYIGNVFTLSADTLYFHKKDQAIDESYLICIPGNKGEDGKMPASVVCPYCLGSPIKYSYYKSGHRKMKKHLLNRERALNSGNYYRFLLDKYQPGYEGEIDVIMVDRRDRRYGW